MIDEIKLTDEIKNWIKTDRFEDFSAGYILSDVIEEIDKMPKVGEWIPVTHEIDEESGEYTFTCQLPEEGERVIVVDRRGYIDIDEQCYDTDGWYLDGGDWDDIVAWMPLPEAYGEESAE